MSEPAPVVRRVVAYAIDAALAYAAVVAFGQLVVFAPLQQALGTTWRASGLLLELWVLATISLPVWSLFAWFEGRASGATPGKRLLGVRVVCARGGARVGFGRAWLRNAVKLLPWECAHLALNVPDNPFVDPETGEFRGVAGGEFRPAYLLTWLLLGAWLLAAHRDAQHRGVHDRAAGTRVVRAARC